MQIDTWMTGWKGWMNGLQGQPQCRRKTTIVGLSGSFSFSCDGAWSPTFGTGATCFGGGDLKDWSSFVNICVSVGGAIFGCRACQGLTSYNNAGCETAERVSWRQKVNQVCSKRIHAG